MLELKVRPLRASQIEFLRRWDAEDDDSLRGSYSKRCDFTYLCARLRMPPVRLDGRGVYLTVFPYP